MTHEKLTWLARPAVGGPVSRGLFACKDISGGYPAAVASSYRVALLAFLAAACGPGVEAPSTPTPIQSPAATFAPPLLPALGSGLSCSDPFGSVRPDFPIGEWTETDFCRRGVEFAEIRFGGQPADGIPPVDSPVFEGPDSAGSWIEQGWPILVVKEQGEVRGFPLAVLLWHEIVNTEIGGMPVAATYSPLSNSARAFDRRLVDGTALDFGTTGNLRFANTILYDRQTATWWQQLMGEAIVGRNSGTRLTALPAQILAWEEFTAIYPQALVLSRETSHVREYGFSPFAGLDGTDGLTGVLRALVEGEPNDRLAPLERVVAMELGGVSVAYPFQSLSEVRVINDVVDGVPVVVFWKEGARSALDEGELSNSRNVGSTAAFRREVEGQLLTFEWATGAFRDLETGSEWDLAGRAVSGPLASLELVPLVSAEPFWFVWAAFQPETEVRKPPI